MADKNRKVSLAFETMYKSLGRGEKIGISGSLKAIGEWNPKKCVVGNEFPYGSGRWIIKLELPPLESLEWKWVVVSKDGSRVLRWEERANRVQSTGVSNGRIIAPWNSSTSFVPDDKTSNLYITNSSAKYTTRQDSNNDLRRGSSLLDRFNRNNPCVLL